MTAKKTSIRVLSAIDDMYAKMARAAASKALELAGERSHQLEAEATAEWAEKWAIRAGGNALRWGLF